ncbi:MAG: anaerobic glycerol-3-phosphate dehydrogenase subunit C [Ignavibacteriales bacterium]|nr:anaerobic glycerol-3-phosphate dehydrogenase subunit C [Ignavibacteriales bacterium]
MTLHLYSTAACFYEVTPLAVVIPETIDDIRTAARICWKHEIPILPRGAGSSLSGNAVGKAVVLDLSHHFKDIELLSGGRVRCGVSVVLNQLQDRLKDQQRKLGPDPSSGNVCVIGGMLGNNSGGPHTIKHGNMVHHVDEISVVLANGQLFKAKNILLADILNLVDSDRHYYEQVRSLMEKHAADISASKPLSTKNASGYQVWGALTETHLNMASLLVGSEGTLGIFTDAVVRTLPLVKHRGIISFYFADLASMGTAVRHLRALGASAIEFVDQSFIKLALTFRPELKEFLPADVQYLLYVEFEDDNIDRVNDVLLESKAMVCDRQKLAEVGSFSTNEEEIEKVIRVRKAATVILNKIQGKEKPVPFVEDAAIHPDVFTEFLIDLSALLRQYPFKYAIFGHAGDGNLHLRPILNFKDPQSFRHAEDLMEKFVGLVVKHKGTLSGEHGDGRLRTPFVDRTFPRLIPLFKELKALFDPAGILNPGIKVANLRTRWVENLRYSPAYQYVRTSSGLDSDLWRTEIEKCHGCGTCREYCPVFIATGDEEATGRAKANILRKLISGQSEMAVFDTGQFYSIMDYCVNCGQCLTDCPTGVNIPGMAMLAKEKLHEKRPYKINEFILQRGMQVSSLAALMPALSNTALSIPLVRTLMEATAGIDSRRNLPPFAARKEDPRSAGVATDKKVVLWSGCAAQFNDPDGELSSCIKMLNKLGYEVILPDWKCCNVAKLSYGNFRDSKSDIEYNVKTLLPCAQRGIPIVFTSASCGYAFMHEYRALFPDNESIRKIVESSFDVHDFLAQIIIEGGHKKSFIPLRQSVAYHAPCHLKTQKNKYGPTDLLKLIPELTLVKIKDSCCGIAGTFGMKKENFDLSMEIGSRLFAEIERAHPEVVLSGCGTCQIQINQGTGIEVVHPMTLINEAFQPASS